MMPHVQVNLRGHLSNLNGLYSLKLQVSVSKQPPLSPLHCFSLGPPWVTPQGTLLVTTTTKAAKTLCPAARPLSPLAPGFSPLML